jgi:photosystem II stability/assembly factor-like uncharacterized protein
MRDMTRLRRLPLVLLVLAASGVAAGGESVPERFYDQLRWRFLGPLRGGWALCATGVPGSPTSFLFGAADGGAFRSDDAGRTWQPIFERYGSAAVGALVVAPSDPNVIWLGTGQVQQRWDLAAGDGVYRSTDGGKTFESVGLRETRHIGRIWVDPRDARVALVAALGHVFGPNPERGLFRTEDAGHSWQQVLRRDDDTGAVDIAGDPALPDVLYAALWQVRRHPWMDYFQPAVGPGGGVWKSLDAGRTWTVVKGAGLPALPLGRISLAVGLGSGARRLYALVDAPKGSGLYRSEDGGESFELMNGDRGLTGSYMNMVVVDPRDADVVYAMGRSVRRSSDGGRHFTFFKGAPGGDDYHFLWIDPKEPQRMMLAADQGAVVTLNGGRSWSSWYNEPTGQFYRLAADDQFPYRIYSGQQDSGTVTLPVRTDYGQNTFRDWHPVGGDERDGDVPDPQDPNVVYGAGLGGRISKWDGRTGQVQNVSPSPISTYGERPRPELPRYSWITPLAISPRPPHAVYTAAQTLWRSTDGGHSWQTISPDLTGARPGAPRCEGDVALADASACGLGVIFAITPSAAADGLVWVGTDNGRVQLTRDEGRSWSDVTPTDMTDWTKVNIIDASPRDPATAYVAADRHRLDDFRPLAWRTHDYGKSWTEIGHGLPAGAWVGVVRQDPVRRGLLYAGTSRGVHVSFDDGESWQSLQLGLPVTGVNDLVVKNEDVIAATQGRGLWALDGVTPLRHLDAETLAGEPVLTPPAVAYRVAYSQNKDTPLPPEEPRAPDFAAGAVIDYFLPAVPHGPVTLEIADSSGQVVRRFRSDEAPESPPSRPYFAELWRPAPPTLGARAGHNRFVWDLRYPRPRTNEYEYSIAAVPGRSTPLLPAGPYVLPGRYEARLSVDSRTLRQSFTVAQDPRRHETPDELRSLLDFEREAIGSLEAAADAASQVTRLEARLAALDTNPRARGARPLLAQVRKELAAVAGTDAGASPGTLEERLRSLETDLESSDAPPTESERQLLADSRVRMEPALQRLEALRSGALARLDARLRALGVEEPKAPARTPEGPSDDVP